LTGIDWNTPEIKDLRRKKVVQDKIVAKKGKIKKKCNSFMDFLSDMLKCAKFSFRGSSYDYVLAPFLNLLFYLPLSCALQGQPEAVWRYEIRKDMCDMPTRPAVSDLSKKLKEIFPHSFLFQSEPSQIEYRDDRPRVISLETLEILYHQILIFDFSGQIEGEKCLAQLVREAWLRTQTPIPHMTLALAGDDFLAPSEIQKGLTWLWDDKFIDSCSPHKILA
jgi:hypothetical protein